MVPYAIPLSYGIKTDFDIKLGTKNEKESGIKDQLRYVRATLHRHATLSASNQAQRQILAPLGK